MRKKMMSVKVILLSVLFVLPMLASAFNGKAKVGGIWYNIVTKAERAEVTKPDVGIYSGTAIKIPSTIVYEGVTCKVTAIEEQAFQYAEVASVTIPNSVTRIDGLAFQYCDIKSIIIPNSVTEIGSYAFKGSALSSVTLSQNLRKIETGLFKDCNNLKSITIPNSVTLIESNAFEGCGSLTSVTLNNGLDSIRYEAFRKCESLQTITIPNSVRYIESQVFEDCSRLTTVIIGSGVEEIGFTAFSKCRDLKDFYLNGDRLPYINIGLSDVFAGSEIAYTTLHVAESLIEACKQFKPWNEFGKMVVNPNTESSNTASVSHEKDETIYERKDCNGDNPSFYNNLEQWLAKNLQYPTEAKSKGITGTVFVNIVVEPDGAVSNIGIMNSTNELLNAEAIRLVSSMPKWKAGKVNGKYVRVKETVPVVFRLSEQDRKEIEKATATKQRTEEMGPIYDVVSEMPSFPGGQAQLQTWLKANMRPTDGVSGRVMIKFVVEKDGTISNAEILRSLNPTADNEAIRLVESMPQWNPGKKDGEFVRVWYTLPITF